MASATACTCAPSARLLATLCRRACRRALDAGAGRGSPDLYPKIDLGYRFGSWSTHNGVSNPGGFGGVAFQGSAGVAYRRGVVTLRAEVGSGALRLGAGFVL